MNKNIITGGVLCFLLFSVFEANGESLDTTTLQEAVNVSLETNPRVEADEAALEASEYDVDAARSGFFPSVDALGGIGRQKTKLNYQNDPPFSFAAQGSVKRNISTPSLRISQILFDGFSTIFTVDRAQELVKTAMATLGLTREQTAFDAITAFITLYTQQRRLELAENNIKKHEEILSKVERRVQGGISTKADVDQVKSRLQEALVLRDQVEEQLDVAIADFISVVGFEPEKLESPSFPRDLLSLTLGDIVAKAIKDNPAVSVASNRLKVAEAALNQTLSPFMPTIRLQLDADKLKNNGGQKGNRKNQTAQIVGSYNLFSGGRDYYNRKAQMSRVVQAKKLLDSSRRDAEKGARSAWSRVISSDEQKTELMRSVEVNSTLEKEYELQFALVSRPLVDVLNAYISYYRSADDLINAEAQGDINYALLLGTVGNLVSYFEGMEKEKNPTCSNKTEFKPIENMHG